MPQEYLVFTDINYLWLFISGWKIVMISPATLACQLVLLLCGCGLNNHVVEILWMQISHYRSGRHYLTVDILVF